MADLADIKEVFKQAAEIARQVPENMQEAAFNRALDFLSNKSSEKGSRRTKRNSKNKHAKVNLGSDKEHSAKPNKKPRKTSSGLGPKPAVQWLIDSGYLATGKTVTQMQEYLKRKRGYDIDKRTLQTAVIRLLRDEFLEREENQEGEYEYKQANR